MKKIICILIFISFNFAFSKDKKKENTNNESQSIVKVDNKYSYKLINSNDGTFGYDILTNNKIMIHQPNIPAVSGNKGFKSKKQAEKVATFVIFKLQKNIMPPSVTPHEIDSLNLIK